MKPEDIKQIAVIGAGLMGVGIGVEFARFGCSATLYNTRESTSKKAMENASRELELMVEAELISPEQAEATYQRLRPTIDLRDAVSGADYVIESVHDKLALKQDIFARLDEMCPPQVVLATNTTALRVTDIAAKATKYPERILLTHYFEPPHLVPLVEVGKGEKTDPQLVEPVTQLLKKMRKKVVVVNVDVAGGVGGTRLQVILQGEINRMYEEWKYTPQMIDDIFTFGIGRRLPFVGPFVRQDLLGLDFFYNSDKERGAKPWPPIAEMVERGDLGMKSGKGWYDWPPEAIADFNRRYKLGLSWLLKQEIERGDI